MKTFLIAGMALALAGCAYPTSSIQQGQALGHVRMVDAPVGTQLVVDGRVRGTRSAEKADVFDVEPGRHVIEQTLGGRVLLRKEYLIGAGSVIEIRSAP